MLKQRLSIINKLGLHARAAAKFVDVASRYQSDIDVQCNGQSANGKSIMSVMLLAAAQGSELDVTITGDDETEAMAGLAALLAARFDEPE